MVAPGVIGESGESASPVCYIDGADDIYLGFASKAEIVAFLAELAGAERLGQPTGDMLRRMLPRIRDDRLHRELAAKLTPQPGR